MIILNLIQNGIKTKTIQLHTLNQFILYVELAYPLCLICTSKLNEEIQMLTDTKTYRQAHTYTFYFLFFTYKVHLM